MSSYTETLLECLRKVEDPEIPGMSIVDLGMVREIEEGPDGPVIGITPTYSGCPALDVIEREIVQELEQSGYENVRVVLKHAPPWSSSWITERGRQILTEAGIAPPKGEPALYQIGDTSEPSPVPCPRCESLSTHRTSEYGATSCKSLWYCESCQEPFEYFKSF